jgi:putative ribosome biogenesis GTPase RsgA
MRYVNVSFEVSESRRLRQEDSKRYAFKTDFKDLNVGDCVVVETSRGFAVGVVCEELFSSTDVERATAWVVSKVDLESHNKRLELEAEKNKVLEKLEERKKSLERVAVYQMLAEKDPEMKALLDSLNELEVGGLNG